jgi:hypothetical protein
MQTSAAWMSGFSVMAKWQKIFTLNYFFFCQRPLTRGCMIVPFAVDTVAERASVRWSQSWSSSNVVGIKTYGPPNTNTPARLVRDLGPESR